MANLDISKIDWKKLRQQKRWVIQKAENGSEFAEGLLGFLDWFQDEAVGWGPSETTVFGETDDDGEYIEEFDENLEYIS